MKELADEQIAEFREASNLFDRDGDGVISAASCCILGMLLRSLGYSASTAEVHDTLSELGVCRVMPFGTEWTICSRFINAHALCHRVYVFPLGSTAAGSMPFYRN